jgi:hypothetical protein
MTSKRSELCEVIFKSKGERKSFSDKQKVTVFVFSRHVLHEIIKEILQRVE